MLDDATKERIDADIASEDVVLYMKGTPVFPQCGFSAAVVGVLTHLGVPFRGINVLEDDSIREGIKAYSDWPTIPQLYVKREFVGGCDIIREMYETGELAEMFQTHGIDAKTVLITPRDRAPHPSRGWHQKSGGRLFQRHGRGTNHKIPCGPFAGLQDAPH